MRARIAEASLLVAMAVLALPTRSWAAPTRERIDVSVPPEVDASSRFDSAIRAQLVDVADLVGPADPGAATLRVQIARTPAGLELSLLDAGGAALTKPRLLEGDDEVAASAAGAIVRAYVVAKDERSPEPPPEPPRAPAPRPVIAPAPATIRSEPRSVDVGTKRSARSTLRIGALYTGTSYASALAWQNGGRIEASLALGSAAYVGLGYAFSPGATVSTPEVDVRIARHGPGAFVGVEVFGQRFGAGLDLGAAIDVSSRSTTRAAVGLDATSDSTYASAAFTLRGHGRLRLRDGLALDLAPALELAPGAPSFALGVEGSPALLAPRTARFRLDVGGTFDAF
jgi:hypothetical protein